MRSALWHIILGVCFAYLVVKGAMWLFWTGLIHHEIPLLDLTVMALAIFRLIRLVSYDVITQFFRDALARAPHDSFVGTLHSLVACPWCSGLWWSFFVVFAYYATPLAWPILLILALAGVASFIQVLANLVGWSAEQKKRETLGDGHESKTTCG